MHLFTLIFGIVLLPKAYTLKCYECMPGISGTCTDTINECSSGQCGSLRMTSYAGSSKIADVSGKKCSTLADHCGEISVNFGIARTILTNKCCTSDLCNAQPAPEPSMSSPNGKKCYQCNGKSCTATVNCNGNEDHCITTEMAVGDTKVTMKGCASKQFCTKDANAQISSAIGGNFECCQGNFCNGGNGGNGGNSASSTSAGLLLLVAPLVSSVMFS